ncbi:hypothetical protein [Polaribacter sp.]|uniref:hypothetical protein n=1 Tax=Polaribacter sp. TaxID=1920175 RepID=UPI00404809D4
MKKQILILLAIVFLNSCKNNDDFNLQTEVVGNWQLIQMTGNIPNSTTKGAEMEWQETYQFFIDGTFLKTRNRDGIIKEVSGTYNLKNNTSETLELNFTSESEIIGSCTSNIKETLKLQSETIFLSSWNACDGPGLKYEKVN